MRPGAVLINTARGPLVDERALLEALDSGQIAAAGLDVVETEPLENERLRRHPNILLTPHTAFYSVEGYQRAPHQDRRGSQAHPAGRTAAQSGERTDRSAVIDRGHASSVHSSDPVANQGPTLPPLSLNLLGVSQKLHQGRVAILQSLNN